MTMELDIDGGIDGGEFKDLLGLLLSAWRELDRAGAEKGVRSADVRVEGVWKGVGFRAGWVWG
jgi:hypothetical protein